MSQTELAKKAKINQSYLSALEHDKKSPTLRMLFTISEALEVCPYLLLTYDRYCKHNCIHNCIHNIEIQK